MRTAQAALAYFGLVFAAGFALGTVRTLVLVPALGERNAELLETPFMVAITFLAAAFVVARMPAPSSARRAAVGVVALLLLLAAEWAVVHFVRHQSLAEYAAGRDPLSGAAYLFALALFAAAPSLVRRGEEARRARR